MKTIQIKKWKVKKNENEEVEDSTLNIINYIMSIGQTSEKLTGFDNMRRFNRIGLAIDSAEKTGVLELEDNDYDLIKNFIEKHSPAVWGNNNDIMDSVEEIMRTK